MAANQKIILTVCVVAGFVALVASQNVIDAGQCVENVRGAARTMRESYQKILNQLIQELSKEANPSANLNQLSSQMNQMITLSSSLADTSNFSSSRYTATLSQMASTYTEMIRTMLNTRLTVNSMRIFMRTIASSTSTYATFVMQVPESCTP